MMVGPSNSGKTNTVLYLLYHGIERFSKLYIYAKMLEEEIYQWFIDEMRHVRVDGKDEKGRKVKIEVDCIGNSVFLGNEIDQMVPLEDIDPDEQNVVIIDDFVSKKNDLRSSSIVKDYFYAGRKKNMTVYFLSQVLKGCPYEFRQQATQWMLFANCGTYDDLKEIGQTLAPEMKSQDFIRMYSEATKEPYSFLYVDLETKDPRLKYRQNFDKVLSVYVP